MSKKDEELAQWLASEEPTINTTELSQWLNSEEIDPSIPLAEFTPDNRISRELTTSQKGINKLANIFGQGGVSTPYPENVTAQQLEYENINPLYATYEAGKSMVADLASLGSAAGGYATDQTLGRLIDQDIKPFTERMAESNFQPDISKKGKLYRQKFDENVMAITPLNQLSAISRLKPVAGMPNQISNSVLNPSDKIKKGMQVVGDEISDITSAIGSKLPKTLIGNESRSEATKQMLLRSGIKPTQKQQVKMQTYGGNSAYDDAVEIIFKDNVTLDPKGIQKIKDNAKLAGDNLEDFIEQNKNVSIKKSKVFDNIQLQNLRKKYIESVDGQKDLKAFDAVIDNFKNANKGKTFTVKDAQKIKSNTYAILNKKAYSNEPSLSAADEAKKYVARVLKEEIERATTRLGIDGQPINKAKELNRETQRYINALDVITKREFVSGRSNPIHGLALLSHDPLLMGAQHLQASTPFKVNVARLINRLQTNQATPIKDEVGYISQMVNNAMTKMSPIDNIRAAGLLQNEPEEMYESLLRKKQ